jgi:hypothetical protein
MLSSGSGEGGRNLPAQPPAAFSSISMDKKRKARRLSQGDGLPVFSCPQTDQVRLM